jgi:hypothetical protein
MDNQGDADGGRWMSYAELALTRGISRSSAERLVRRRRWRKQTDNRGNARAYVPADAISPLADDRQDSRRDARANDRADVTRAFEAGLAALREAHERERTSWGEERTRWGEERARLLQQLEQAHQSEDARRALGRWARLRRAWAGG